MLFILKNHPFYEQFNKEIKTNNLSNRNIKNLEFQLKKRFEKSVAFNPDDCYTDTENSEDNSIASSQLNSSTQNKIKDRSLDPQKRKSIDSNNLSSISSKKNRINEKISYYKKLIKIFDLLAVFLIVTGAILSQYEQELYYQSNLIYRIPGVIMKEYISANPTNHTLSLIFDEANVDLNSLTNFNFENYVAEYNAWTIDNPQIIASSENLFILSKINISLFGYSDDIKDSTDIKIPLFIPDLNNSLRIIMLITTCISCIFILTSWYIEHNREYLYKKELHHKFYKGEYFLISVIEIAVILLVQYPKINSYIIIVELGSTLCLPISSILSSLSIFRFVFIYKIFKNFTKWNSEHAEIKCERYVCNADTRFAFKALQKENPFFTLCVIFILTCVCFGLSLRIFELHFWETQSVISQDWSYQWNAMWCVFVSMTTVGYGDFYPKTHFGRFIIIIACMAGIYFVSMTMVFMTGESVLNETELKAYKLIARLKLRHEMKDLQAKIIYHGLIYAKIKSKSKKENQANLGKKSDVEFNYQKRCIFSLMTEVKKKEMNIKNFNFVNTKEQLIETCERIDTDIKEIKKQIEVLFYLNNSLIEYSFSQADMLKHLRKNVYAMRFTFIEIESKPQNFGLFANYDKNLVREIGISEHDDYRREKNELGEGEKDNVLGIEEDKDSTVDKNENYSPERKDSKFLENCSSSEDENSYRKMEDFKNTLSIDEEKINHFDHSTPEKENVEALSDKNLKVYSEDLIKFKNPLSSGLKYNSDDDKELKRVIILKRPFYSENNKVEKRNQNFSLSKFSPNNLSTSKIMNVDYSGRLSSFNASAEEIKSHFNSLVFNQQEIFSNNITKFDSNFESPSKNILKDDELKIKTMVSKRRVSSRKIKIYKK